MSKEQIVDFLDNLGWTDNPHLGDESEAWMLSPCEEWEVIAYADGQWSLSRRSPHDSDEWEVVACSPFDGLGSSLLKHGVPTVSHVR